MSSFKKIRTNDSYIAAVNSLYEDLNRISKSISYLDVYNIVDVVTEKNRFAFQLSSLQSNSSLVINSEPFDFQGETYNMGDIILKNNLGNTVHISAQSGGVYYPKSLIPNGNNYEVTYAYSPSAPMNEEWSSSGDSDGNADKPYNEMTFEIPQQSSLGSIYGLWQEMESNSHIIPGKFADKEKTNRIQPQIQFWACDEENNSPIEQVFIDYTLAWNTSEEEYTVTINGSNNLNLHVKVK